MQVQPVSFCGKETNSNKKFSKILYAAAPVAAGVVAAASNNTFVQTVGKTGFGIKGVSARIANGVKAGGALALALGLIDLVFKTNNTVVRNSSKAREFERNHPMISTVGLFGASLAAIKGGESLLKGAINKIPDKAADKIVETVFGATGKINGSKFIDNIASTAAKLADKIHPAIKQAGARVLPWTPFVLLVGSAICASAASAASAQKKAA